MSSILEALRELEGDAPARKTGEPWPAEPRRRGRRALVIVGAAVVAGGAALLVGRGREVRPPAAAPNVVATSPAAPRVADARAEPPAPPAHPRATAHRERPTTRVTPPAAIAALAVEEPAARAAAPVPETVVPRPPGEPRVRLTALRYASSPDDRSVALSVNGGRTVTLHEGESAAQVEVSLIMRDRVYLRHAGHIFAVHARP